MLLEAVTHWETGPHGMELILGLDLCRDQHHRCTTTDAVKGDLLDMGRDIMEASVDEGAPDVDDRRSHVRRQLEGLQLHRQGWQS